jgi:hypothetical protein
MTSPDTSSPDTSSAGWVQEALREHETVLREHETELTDLTEHEAGTRFEHHGSPQPLPGTVREELVLERIDRVLLQIVGAARIRGPDCGQAD